MVLSVASSGSQAAWPPANEEEEEAEDKDNKSNV